MFVKKRNRDFFYFIVKHVLDLINLYCIVRKKNKTKIKWHFESIKRFKFFIYYTFRKLNRLDPIDFDVWCLVTKKTKSGFLRCTVKSFTGNPRRVDDICAREKIRSPKKGSKENFSRRIRVSGAEFLRCWAIKIYRSPKRKSAVFPPDRFPFHECVVHAAKRRTSQSAFAAFAQCAREPREQNIFVRIPSAADFAKDVHFVTVARGRWRHGSHSPTYTGPQTLAAPPLSWRRRHTLAHI